MNIFNHLLLQYLYTDLLFLINIFKYKHLRDGVLVNCQKNTINIGIEKMFFDNYIKINIVDIGDSAFKTDYEPSRFGFIVNTSCDDWVRVVNGINIKNKFRYPLIWIFLTKNISSVVTELKRFPLEIDSDVSIIDNNDLYDVYNTGFDRNGKLTVEMNGKINETMNVRERHLRKDLSNVQLRGAVVVISNDNNLTLSEYVKQVKMMPQVFDSLHRLKYLSILLLLRNMYNMTYKFQLTNSWGYRHNGSFDGMVGILERNEADIGGSPIFFTSDRNEILDYAAQVWPTSHSFIFRHPRYQSHIFNIFARPLSIKVWYCVLAMFILSVSVTYFMFKIKIFIKEKGEDTSLSLAILLMWSALCQQGMPVKQNSTPINILLFIILVYTILLYNYYNGVVVSILLMDAPKSIKTLKDLLDSELKVGDEGALYDREYFEHTTDSVAIELYNKKIIVDGKKNFYTPEEGMDLVKRGGFAFHVDTVVSYGIMRKKFSESEICEIQEVIMYVPEKLGAVLSKNSPYKNHFAYGIRRMMEAGLLQKMRSDWDEPKPPCVKLPDKMYISVSIMELSLPIIVFIMGVLTSLVVLLFEILLNLK